MLRDEPVLEHESHLMDRGHERDFAMRVLHRDRILIVIKPHQRLRIDGAVIDSPRLEGLLGQRQKRRLVFLQELFFRGGLPSSPLGSICHTTFPQMFVEHFEGTDFRHRHEKVPPGKPDRYRPTETRVSASRPSNESPLFR